MNSEVTPEATPVEVTGIIEKVKNYLDTNGTSLLYTLFIFLVGLIIIKLLSKLIDKAFIKSKITPSLRTFVVRATKIILFLVLIVVIAGRLGLSTSSFVAVISAAGLAISLSLQDGMSNIINGIFLIVSKPFKLDSVVNIDGIDGVVEEIGTIYTKLKTIDKQVLIPNSDVASAKIIDLSAYDYRRTDIRFLIGYEEDIEKVRDIVLTVSKETGLVVEDPVPTVAVIGFGELGIQMSGRFWVKVEDYWPFVNEIYELIRNSLNENGILMPYSSLGIENKTFLKNSMGLDNIVDIK
ncbi:MAG: mechanosensitive ion channel family protein [Ruminococcaceae bacterium]|nr:mechanosensitive ion channel family protein [Oscillospiraceae bacterium]